MPPAADGRPTPQPTTDGRPRFRDTDDVRHPDANPYLITHRTFGPPLIPADAAWTLRGRWDAYFGRAAPLHVEIGSGNGFFLAGAAARHPEWNLVGIELRYKRTVLCARKLREAGAQHAAIVRYHAAFLDDLFEDGSLAGLHVHHPDPWPKDRHEKNRLISRWFLEDAARLLQPGGVFRLKTDHVPHLERIEHVLDHHADDTPAPPLPFDVVLRREDVHAGPFAWTDGEPDIVTNYQRKFRDRGLPVGAVELRRRADPAGASRA